MNVYHASPSRRGTLLFDLVRLERDQERMSRQDLADNEKLVRLSRLDAYRRRAGLERPLFPEI